MFSKLNSITQSFIDTYLPEHYQTLTDTEKLDALARLIRHVATDIGHSQLLQIGVLTSPTPVRRPPMVFKPQDVVTVGGVKLTGFKTARELTDYVAERVGENKSKQYYPILMQDQHGVLRMFYFSNIYGSVTGRLSALKDRGLQVTGFYFIEHAKPTGHQVPAGLGDGRFYWVTMLLEEGFKLSAESIRSFSAATQSMLVSRYPFQLIA